MSSNEYGTFAEVRARLDEIVVEVRNKDLPLEKSLDLYEEAIKLGNRCAELVDKPDFSPEEAAAAYEALENETGDMTISGQPAVDTQTSTEEEGEKPSSDEHGQDHEH